MWGPGSRHLLEHCDSQTEVRPRLGTGVSDRQGCWCCWSGLPSAFSPGRSHPRLGRDAAAPSQGPEEGRERQAGKSASAGESHAPSREAQRDGVTCPRSRCKGGTRIGNSLADARTSIQYWTVLLLVGTS